MERLCCAGSCLFTSAESISNLMFATVAICYLLSATVCSHVAHECLIVWLSSLDLHSYLSDGFGSTCVEGCRGGGDGCGEGGHTNLALIPLEAVTVCSMQMQRGSGGLRVFEGACMRQVNSAQKNCDILFFSSWRTSATVPGLVYLKVDNIDKDTSCFICQWPSERALSMASAPVHQCQRAMITLTLSANQVMFTTFTILVKHVSIQTFAN